ncbi:MAG: hypothetical protein M1834_002291 [Cirrosporium novae-zelandiae]|nr:MAG: hypothetical protein M1834_002291 [Cirrosporium novae-zelandiae]
MYPQRLEAPKLTAFEHTPSPISSSALPPKNTLLFIGGMTDGFLTVPYVTPLANYLHNHPLSDSYSVVEILLSSSYNQWGLGSVSQDAEEISKCVAYFRNLRPNSGKMVFLGHSTGCQDIMEYLTGAGAESRERVDGAIFQASVSDREALDTIYAADTSTRKTVDELNNLARTYVNQGRGSDTLPFSKTGYIFPGVPISGERWLSVVSPASDYAGSEDFFSSDLPDERLKNTFRKIAANTKVAIMFGGSDEYVPPRVDREALVSRWVRELEEGEAKVDREATGVLEGATHNLDKVEGLVLREFMQRVRGFLEKLRE